MPTIEENRFAWGSACKWDQEGDEWSAWWGGAEMQWRWSILPRISPFLPTGTILELGPGHGRWTRFLKDLCERLILVDLAGECIEACERRFDSCQHISYHTNDGKSLEMIASDSVDFVFSFDSLVHAESDVMESYLQQLASKLTVNGVGFIHHSNLGEYSGDRASPKPSLGKRLEQLIRRTDDEDLDDHWRARSMTATKFSEHAEDAGLVCIGQETVNWGSTRLIDCMSLFTRSESIWVRPNVVVRNSRFMEEAKQIRESARLYDIRPSSHLSIDRSHATCYAWLTNPTGQ